MRRVLSVARLQLVAWPSVIGWPWVILASSFVINLALFAIIGDEMPDDPRTGALVTIYTVTFIGALMSINQDFPFALGLSVTRRVFYTALSALLIAQSLVYGVLLYLLKLIEDATGGWGISMSFFGLPFLVQDNPLFQILIYTVPFITLGFLGTCIGLVFKRWGLTGLFALALAAVLVSGGLIMLVTWQRWWPTVGDWLFGQSPVSLFAGWPALLALTLAGTGYLTIRRATP